MLTISKKTLRAHIKAGEIAYIPLGIGEKRVRMGFDRQDVIEFIERRRKRQCPSTNTPKVRSTNTTSSSTVIGFLGSTRTKSKRDALKFEADVREQARKDIAAARKSGNGPLTLDIAADRYWLEIGQHHANSDTTWTNLARLVSRLGKDKRMDAITDADVASLVAWRRSQTVHGRTADKDGQPVPTISPATVNRSTTMLLKAIFSRAKRTWRYQFPAEPNWRDHMLKEPKERVRELDAEEANALDAAVRDDFAPWFEFARLSARRRNETLIRWSDVNIFAKRITTTGKGGALISTPITRQSRKSSKSARDTTRPLFSPSFAAAAQRTGERQALSDHGRGRENAMAAPEGESQGRRLPFHDIRHDVATKLLRATGNLKLVQRALNHADIKTTTKYAHVLDDEVAAALEHIANPRKKSRNTKLNSA